MNSSSSPHEESSTPSAMDMDVELPSTWALSQSLEADGQGIRAACLLPPLSFPVSSSTDITQDPQDHAYRLLVGTQSGSLFEFALPSGNLILHPPSTAEEVDTTTSASPLFQHDHAVTALLSSWTDPTAPAHTDPPHVYVSACKDAQVRVFQATSHRLRYTLSGHEKPVTSLAWARSTTSNFLVTGSWDGTAKVWHWSSSEEASRLVATLPNHENSVCVASLPPDTSSPTLVRVVTGSAGVASSGNTITGHTLRLWQVSAETGQINLQHVIAQDHDGPIRDVGALSSVGTPGADSVGVWLATCSNDGTVKLRQAENGQAWSTLAGDLAALAQHQPPMLLSLTLIATVQGDVVWVCSGAEDGQVLWWKVPSASGLMPQQVENQSILHPNCVWKVLALPDGDVGTCCQDGVFRIFTRRPERMASTAEQEKFQRLVQASQKATGPTPDQVAQLPVWAESWRRQGTSEGQVQLFQKDGTAIAAQWSMASQTWIEVGQVVGSPDVDTAPGTLDGVQYDHILPIEVDQTGGGVARLQIGYNTGENPFVAAQRFIDQHMLPQYHLSEIADYIRQRVGHAGPTLGGSGLPSAATTGVPLASFQYLPSTTYQKMDLPAKTAAVTMEKMKNKILEFQVLSADQVTTLSSLVETLAATNRYHSSQISDGGLQVIWTMLETLPSSQVFPALDLARLAVLHPDAASVVREPFWDRVTQQALILCQAAALDPETGAGPTAGAVPMLSLRLWANAMSSGLGSLQAVVKSLDSIVACMELFVNSSNKNIRLSVATLLYNIGHYLRSIQVGNHGVLLAPLMSLIQQILRARTYEADAMVRVLVTLGTLAMTSSEAKDLARSMFLVSLVEPAASPLGDTAKGVAKEVYSLLA